MTDGVQVDDKELILALNRMSPKKMDSAYRTAMKKSLDPILKQTKANLRTSGIKGVTKPYISRKTGKKYISMMQGVKTSVEKSGESGKVHIMKEFRLKFFEKGTTLRKTSRGWNRGSITPHWFFRDAVNQKGKEATDSLEENVRNEIIKKWERQ